MSKKTITIADLKDVRDGDICTVEIGGRQYTGPAYNNGGSDDLFWSESTLRYPNGKSDPYITFISATRVITSLPTELGSAILIHEALGEVCYPPVLAVRNGRDMLPWCMARRIGRVLWLKDADITQWQECSIVTRGKVRRQ